MWLAERIWKIMKFTRRKFSCTVYVFNSTSEPFCLLLSRILYIFGFDKAILFLYRPCMFCPNSLDWVQNHFWQNGKVVTAPFRRSDVKFCCFHMDEHASSLLFVRVNNLRRLLCIYTFDISLGEREPINFHYSYCYCYVTAIQFVFVVNFWCDNAFDNVLHFSITSSQNFDGNLFRKFLVKYLWLGKQAFDMNRIIS